MHNLVIEDVPTLNGGKVVCSRSKRGEALEVPPPEIVIQLGDLLYLMGQPVDLHNVQLVIDQEVDTSLSTKSVDLRVERAAVINENMFSKRTRDLHSKEHYDVIISRLDRASVELATGSDISLQFDDILNLVGCPSATDTAASALENVQQKLQ